MTGVKCSKCSSFGNPVYHASVEAVKECFGVKEATPTWGAEEPATGQNFRPHRNFQRATEPQLKFIRRLVEGRVFPPQVSDPVDELMIDYTQKVLGHKLIEFSAASLTLDWLKTLPLKPPEQQRISPPNSQPSPPAGMYALETPGEAFLRFFRVDRPQEGRWEGFVFVKQLTGAPGNWNATKMSKNDQREILEKINEDPQAAAQLFGFKFRQCGTCSSPLSHPQSRAAGYGETCARKHGWYYPTLREALSILDEMGEPQELEDKPEEPK